VGLVDGKIKASLEEAKKVQ
jgi:hypothetical protein